MVISWWLILMMNYGITEREKDWLGRECVIRGVCPSTHSRVKSVLLSFSNILIHNQNYHDITNFANLTMFTLYKILKACVISVNTQIMKWHNKDPGSKNLPLPKVYPESNLDGEFKISKSIFLHIDFCRLIWLQSL